MTTSTSRTTFFLAASSLAVQTINAVQIATETNSAALAMGMDTTWPEDHCCRIYRYEQYEIRNNGKPIDHQKIDVCVDMNNIHEEAIHDFSLNDKGSDGKIIWDNWMSAFKCGKNVTAKFCRLPGDRECKDYMDVESAAGGSESQELGIDNKHTKIVLNYYDPTKYFAATVFSN